MTADGAASQTAIDEINCGLFGAQPFDGMELLSCFVVGELRGYGPEANAPQREDKPKQEESNVIQSNKEEEREWSEMNAASASLFNESIN